jgi:SAM-dependent methyltransferase
VREGPLHCVCAGSFLTTLHIYDQPPPGETSFPIDTRYRRELLRCAACAHHVLQHEMNLGGLYQGGYSASTYGDDGIRMAFNRINALDPSKSDNVGRAQRIVEFAGRHFGEGRTHSVLDVGSGLCVFLHRMKAYGWKGTALDPDERAVAHARNVVGVSAIHGDFMAVQGLGQFDVITFNKVLEHVPDPVTMLQRAIPHVHMDGFVYIELPDGEVAWREGGPDREEFFIEHHHAFSAASAALLAERAGFLPLLLERLREPSGKYTIRAFLKPVTGKKYG